ILRGGSNNYFLQKRSIYYNFIRPHMSLNGKTPAEEAGINLKLEGNKWLALIEKAYNNRDEQPK
ncbi:MAG: hypothetical protein QMD23_02205, partial [Candidatus Bathyarchaeia archaeon]|nr:hypothetical protein [Candidatus Bathyarchaeia archaeon]